MKLLALTGILFFVSLASANPVDICSEIDLREETCRDGRPRMPELRDQGATNYCYAFTLADYYSYLTCQDLSGLYTGVRTNLAAAATDTSDKGKRNGGNEMILNRGMAPEIADQHLRNNGGICLESDFRSDREEIQDERIYSFFSRIWQRRSQPNVLNCAPQALPNVSWRTVIGQLHERQQAIHSALLRKQPVAINFAGDIVTQSDLPANSHPNHVALIAGRKMIGRECHFLLRDPTPIGETPWVQDNGYAWIPESKLIPQIAEVTSVE